MRTLRILAGLMLVLIGTPTAMFGATRWLPVHTADGQRLHLAGPTASVVLLCAGVLVTTLGLVLVCVRGRDEVVLVVEAHRLTEVADRIAARLGGAVAVRHRPPTPPASMPASPAVPVSTPASPVEPSVAVPVVAPLSPAPVSPAVAVAAAAVEVEPRDTSALRAQSGAHRAVGSARLPMVGANVRWRATASAPYTTPPAPVPAGAQWPPMPADDHEAGPADSGGAPARLAAPARAAVTPAAARRNSGSHHRRREDHSDGD
jgi:hypothetical protein